MNERIWRIVIGGGLLATLALSLPSYADDSKQFDTRTLVDGRTAELAGDTTVRLRPIGVISVLGQMEAVPVYDVLQGDMSDELVELGERIAETMAAGDTEAASAAVAALEETCGPCKLVDVYRAALADDAFDGVIRLTQK